ncbi:MarR family winged helix-turn-helix transcriptional regulator [Streptomyces sp. NPDC014622]|uniref:MarR family winged helix-turn-helix transcriptional regulator n=1 Tax=Streptomyces sp. NPDC014622 TaxID=3364874 RepID=UPI0036FE7C5B
MFLGEVVELDGVEGCFGDAFAAGRAPHLRQPWLRQGRERSLGLSRLLGEIGAKGTETRALRSRLGLDSGHVSRQLRRLESQGLVTTDPDENDARARTARLTATGAAGRALLDRFSDELAASMFEPLTADPHAAVCDPAPHIGLCTAECGTTGTPVLMHHPRLLALMTALTGHADLLVHPRKALRAVHAHPARRRGRPLASGRLQRGRLPTRRRRLGARYRP